jgi:hypothetical protein
MVKKRTSLATIAIFLILLVVYSPIFINHFILESRELSVIDIILVALSNLFMLFISAVAIRNYMIKILMEIFIQSSDRFYYEIEQSENVSIKLFQSMNSFMLIVCLITGYSLIVLFLPIQLQIPCTTIFIAVYYMSINMVPNELCFIGGSCIVFNKLNNSLDQVSRYTNKGEHFTFYFSNKYAYDVVVDKDKVSSILQKLASIGL